MDNFEKAQFIDTFLQSIYSLSTPSSFAQAIESKPIPSDENVEKFKTLEYIIEELEVVKLVNGRSNATLNGQCEYLISSAGRKLVEEKSSSLILLMSTDFKKQHPKLFDENAWNKYQDEKIEKRAQEADFFLDLLVSENSLKLDKASLKKHFKTWFKENKPFDIQIKNGSVALEDGALQMVPDFNKNDIAGFLKWFNAEKYNFLEYLKDEGIEIKSKTSESLIHNNTGHVIINNSSHISTQNSILGSNEEKPETIWTKINVITAVIVGIATIIGVLFAVLN